jgi:hypothetical protein
MEAPERGPNSTAEETTMAMIEDYVRVKTIDPALREYLFTALRSMGYSASDEAKVVSAYDALRLSEILTLVTGTPVEVGELRGKETPLAGIIEHVVDSWQPGAAASRGRARASAQAAAAPARAIRRR